jgi:alkylhydroperoxidase family enzyme
MSLAVSADLAERTGLATPATLPAFQAIVTWYELRTTVRPILGERLTTLFAHAISAGTGSPTCAAFFRRLLEQAGEDPDQPRLDEREAAVVRWGHQLGVDPYGVPPAMYAEVANWFSAPELVALATFGALMVATNVLNCALELPVDDVAGPLRRAEVF